MPARPPPAPATRATANYNGSSDSETFAIGKATTVTTVTCDAGPFAYTGLGQMPCSASVTGPGGLAEDLTVAYLDNIDAGTATASASYGATDNYNGSSDSETFVIGKATTVTTVTCDAGPFAYTGRASMPCSASVTGPGGLAEDLTVAYLDNIDAGTATASASYGATDNYNGSSDSETFVIGKATTVTTVTCDAGPFAYTGLGQMPCSASVTGPGGLAEDLTVAYLDNIDAGTATASASYGATDNYNGSSDSETFVIGKATTVTTVVFEAGPYTYRGTPFTATATVTGAGGLSQAQTVDHTGDCTHVTTANGCTGKANYAGDANHFGSSDSKSISIVQATLTVTADPQSKPYGSPNPSPLTLKYSGFVGSEGSAVLGTEPTCSTSATQYSPVAGSPYDITCSGGVDGDYAFSYVHAHLAIVPADALVNYIGETIFVSSGINSNTVRATLTASLQAVDEDVPLGVATVDFVDTLTAKVLAAGVPVAPVEGLPNVGTANTMVTLSTGQYGAESYVIEVVANGNYTNTLQPTNEKTATVVAMMPSAANTTRGGGTLDPAAPAGTYAGDPDTDVTFSVGLQYTSKGTNLQGKVTLSIPQVDGSIVYVKSNSLTSMKIVKTLAGKTSTIYTKASVYRVAGGVLTSIDGNVTFRLDVFEPLINDPEHAQVGFTVLSSKTSNLYYSNRWVLDGSGNAAVWKTLLQPLKSGSVDIN